MQIVTVLLFMLASFFLNGCGGKDYLTIAVNGSDKIIKVYSISGGIGDAWLLETTDEFFLIDAASSGTEDDILKQMKKLGDKKLKLIIISHAHFDHYGSAAALRRKTGAKIAIHKDDAETMAKGETPLKHVRGIGGNLGKFFLSVGEKIWKHEKTEADILLTDGTDLTKYGLNAKVMHTPGHTAGSITVVVGDNAAFCADLFSTRGWTRSQNLYADNWDDVAESFKKIQAIDVDTFYPGHGTPISKEKLLKLKVSKD